MEKQMPEGKKYMDERGWKYKVMSGIGNHSYKARYQKPGISAPHSGWKGVRTLPWRGTFAEAQDDLDCMARERGWRAWQE